MHLPYSLYFSECQEPTTILEELLAPVEKRWLLSFDLVGGLAGATGELGSTGLAIGLPGNGIARPKDGFEKYVGLRMTFA